MVYRTAEYEATVPEIESVDSRALTQLLITGEKSLRTYTFMTIAPASGNAPGTKGYDQVSAGKTPYARVERCLYVEPNSTPRMGISSTKDQPDTVPVQTTNYEDIPLGELK